MPFRPHQDADAAAAPKKAPFRRVATPPAGEADEAPPTPLSRKSLKRNKTAKPTKSNPHDFNGLRRGQTKPSVSHAKRNGRLAPKRLENGAGLSLESQLGAAEQNPPSLGRRRVQNRFLLNRFRSPPLLAIINVLFCSLSLILLR